MACVLKRPLDWDPLSSPQSSNGSKSAPPSANRPNKRRCMFLDKPHVSPPKQPSPFGNFYPNSDQITLTIKEEMKKLHNRKQLNFSSSNTSNNNNSNQASTSSQLDLNTSNGSLSNYNNSGNDVGLLSPSRRDQPLFTFRQVGLICEKLLKERELLIREEYEKVLTSKLAEQYDTFVKFTYDQIQKSFDVGGTPSYLS